MTIYNVFTTVITLKEYKPSWKISHMMYIAIIYKNLSFEVTRIMETLWNQQTKFI